MVSFGQRLKALRNNRGISQNELSKHIGVSKSSVNMYERDEREPGFETLEAIADFFNVNMDYLLGRELHISSSVNSQGATIITVRIDEKKFSSSAQPILAKYVTILNNPDDPDFLNQLDEIRTEIDKYFTVDDLERLANILKSINSAYEQALASINQSQDSSVIESTKGQDPSELGAADGE